MNTKAMRNALKGRLASSQMGAGKAWPNVDFDTSVRPRFEVSTAAARREERTLRGGTYEVEHGRLAVIVCTEKGVGENQALDYADGVSSLFRKGQTIPYVDGLITIMAPAQIEQGYPDDTCFRVPVIIRYRAEE